jgi:peptidoglycan/xylan/chitin deacetylase (PgdA/CDA1 family)
MKMLVKNVLCAAYKCSGALGVYEYFARRAGQAFLAVLLFHRVTDAIPEDGLTVGTRRFRDICRMLRRNFRVVPVAEILRLLRAATPPPPRTVAVTFDDCYRDNLFAAQLLAEHGLPGCFFVPTAFVGTDTVFPWDAGLTRMPNLTWDEVRAMAALGHEIGSHTVTHPDLGGVSAEQTRFELVESRRVLEEQLQRPVRWFAYPFGLREHFREDRLGLVAEAGYEACFSGYGGFIYPGHKGLLLPREPVPYFDSVLNLEVHLTGGLNWYYALKRRLGWIKPQHHRADPGYVAPPPAGAATQVRGAPTELMSQG